MSYMSGGFPDSLAVGGAGSMIVGPDVAVGTDGGLGGSTDGTDGGLGGSMDGSVSEVASRFGACWPVAGLSCVVIDWSIKCQHEIACPRPLQFGHVG